MIHGKGGIALKDTFREDEEYQLGYYFIHLSWKNTLPKLN